jgi:hypothetical protein
MMAALLSLPWATIAKATTLADLLVSGAIFTSGDKVSSNFEYPGSGTAPDAADTNVVAISSPYYGFLLQTDFITGPGQDGDARLEYDVTSQGGLITDVHVSFDGFGLGDATTEASELGYDGSEVIGFTGADNPPPIFSAGTDLD